MTADEAKQALKAGKKVRPKSWYKNCYLEYCLIEIAAGKIFRIDDESVFEDYKDDEWEVLE